ncbi:MAG: hypothetical protein Q7O66_02110 [Dehalococcoidia bacterium]|nr:hypothetical protein [Dehalococcoidia bacterium]
MAFSRLNRQPLKKERIDLAGLVRQALERLGPEREERQVEVTIGDLGFCEADLTLLNQVWVNRLSNALKFTRR